MEKTINPQGYEAPYGVTADAVVFTILDGNLAVLLAKRQDKPSKGAWAIPGGFMGMDEEAQDTVIRKLTEKTGLPPIYVEQLGTYADVNRDPRGRVISIAYLALIPSHILPDVSGWHLTSDLPQLPFDHGRMVADGIERLRGKLWYSNIAVGLLPQAFTARQALDVYAAISGQPNTRPDNFIRDLLATGLIEPTGQRVAASKGGGPRPELFAFVSQQPSWSPRNRR